jgi:hypothetical protein
VTSTPSTFPCSCCGHLVFTGPPGSRDICPVCEWEDDALQLEFPTTLAGGANALTLFEAQRSGAADESHFPRERAWRPIDMAVDEFEDFHEPDHHRAPEDDPTSLYYWRPTFWRRQAVTQRSAAADARSKESR